jgi:hypothetical protein
MHGSWEGSYLARCSQNRAQLLLSLQRIEMDFSAWQEALNLFEKREGLKLMLRHE